MAADVAVTFALPPIAAVVAAVFMARSFKD